MSRLSDLPSVERLLQLQDVGDLVKKHGRTLTLDAIRTTLEELRGEIRSAPDLASPVVDDIVRRTETRLAAWEQAGLQPVINATGVILHTNLGRAPLSDAAVAAMKDAASSYSNLEFDLSTGRRGARLANAETLLQKLLGVEAAVVVNNNAAAVLLALSAMASRKRAVIARSQLVEIGGAFRVPDVMRQSGARLVEVGTTNRVRLADYEQGMAEGDGVALWVHRSNFKIIGFTEEPALDELAQAVHGAGRLLIDDLGSGAILDTSQYGLAHEPTVQEALAAGADLVCFSGDKLLGGPQAGIVVGRAALIQKLRKHPLARALRADKICLAGLAATLLHYLRDEAEHEIPIWRMISAPPESIRARAEKWQAALATGSVVATEATVGGGSLPGESMKSYALALTVRSPQRLLRRLREGNPPVIARTAADQVLLDPRTVLAGQDDLLITRLRDALEPASPLA